jgi:hypothetical protein
VPFVLKHFIPALHYLSKKLPGSSWQNGELSMYIQVKGTICTSQGCWYIPVFGPPVKEPNKGVPEADGEHYADLFADAAIVQSLHLATRQISDSGTRAELERGIASAVKAMEKRGAGQKVQIKLGE